MVKKQGWAPTEMAFFSKPLEYFFLECKISYGIFTSGCKIGVKFLIVDLAPESSKQSTST